MTYLSFSHTEGENVSRPLNGGHEKWGRLQRYSDPRFFLFCNPTPTLPVINDRSLSLRWNLVHRTWFVSPLNIFGK